MHFFRTQVLAQTPFPVGKPSLVHLMQNPTASSHASKISVPGGVALLHDLVLALQADLGSTWRPPSLSKRSPRHVAWHLHQMFLGFIDLNIKKVF